MSSITFNPPLGRTVHVGIPWASFRPTVLLFTAQLSEHDHHQIVKSGGRVQLWSDIPDEAHTPGGWRALDFMERSPVPSGLVVALQSESPAEHEKPKCLYLMVRPPERVQFTYRILYPSGAIVWLGQYEQNGLIFLKESQSLAVDGLDINPGWTFSETRQAYVSENILHAESLGVLRLRALADFQILALAEQGYVINLSFMLQVDPNSILTSGFVVFCPISRTHGCFFSFLGRSRAFRLGQHMYCLLPLDCR